MKKSFRVETSVTFSTKPGQGLVTELAIRTTTGKFKLTWFLVVLRRFTEPIGGSKNNPHFSGTY